MSLDDIARSYVTLVHKIELHHEGYLDGYHGPSELAIDRKTDKDLHPLEELHAEVTSLVSQLEKATPDEGEEERKLFLQSQLGSMESFVRYVQDERFGFTQHYTEIYGAAPPEKSEDELKGLRESLEAKLASINSDFGLRLQGDLQEQTNSFFDLFMIPHDKIEPTIKSVIAQSKKRAKEYITLPEGEEIEIEMVGGKTWTAYNYFLGKARSKIEANRDADIGLIGAIDLAIHETYPGHHTHHAIQEQLYHKEKGWVEFSVHPLMSPQSYVYESLATYIEDCLLSEDERVRMLMELAEETGISERLEESGIAADRQEDFMRAYIEVSEIWHGRYYIEVAAAKKLYDGASDAEVEGFLVSDALVNQDQAERKTRFAKAIPGYSMTYTAGKDIIKPYVDARIAAELGLTPEPADVQEKRWGIINELLTKIPIPDQLTREEK